MAEVCLTNYIVHTCINMTFTSVVPSTPWGGPARLFEHAPLVNGILQPDNECQDFASVLIMRGGNDWEVGGSEILVVF